MNARQLSPCAIGVALLFLANLCSQLEAAPLIHREVSLDAYLLNQIGYVHSYARAFIWDSSNGNRIYKQIIFGHQVNDLDFWQFPVYNFEFVSDNGYASSSTRQMEVQAGHCYQARVSAHANDFNLHELLYTSTDCIPEVPEDVEIPDENCPVLLDLGLDGFHLSGPDPAVRFDIDADGTPDRLAWTKGNGDDAFLCLDRNRNGRIDDGTELFGFATPLLSGQPARIGYRALADLDRVELGGNGDGTIDEEDAMFGSLCVWNDLNRNGVSEQAEIQPAAAAGVVALEYQFRTTRLRDSFGNLFRYVSRGEFRTPAGRSRTWFTYDVIFAEAAP